MIGGRLQRRVEMGDEGVDGARVDIATGGDHDGGVTDVLFDLQ